MPRSFEDDGLKTDGCTKKLSRPYDSSVLSRRHPQEMDQQAPRYSS